MLKLPCFEPAGHLVSLSADDMCRHIIAIGSTGSGKTTSLINPCLEQLVAAHANNAARKPGILVLDPKNDDSCQKILAYARKAGRENDVITLTEGGRAYYSFFDGLDRQDKVDQFARRLLCGAREMGSENGYWQDGRDGLIATGLLILLAQGHPIRFTTAADFFQAWWFSRETGLIDPELEFLSKLLSDGQLSPLTKRRLELALNEARNWAKLDPRTREIFISTLGNVIRPLLSPAAHGFFDESKAIRFHPRDVLQGRILIFSIDAVTRPDLARLLFRVLRQDFYSTIQSRTVVRPDRDRLCAIVCDELGHSAMREDIQGLSVIRAKGGFMLAATQSLNGLDDTLGRRGREALLANFNSFFFFASRETALDELAMLALGVREDRERKIIHRDEGNLQEIGHLESVSIRPVCPPGSLARLAQHQCYVKLADGTISQSPLWLQPQFHDFAPDTIVVPPDDLLTAAEKLRKREANNASGLSAFLVHMHRRGHVLCLTPSVLAAAWQVCTPSMSRNRLLARLPSTMRGLSDLPACWLAGLAGLFARQPGVASVIVGISTQSGVLVPELDLLSSWWGDGSTTIPELLNLRVYPSLWRPLKPRHVAQLFAERPDLRQELASLPQLTSPPDTF